MFGRIFGGYLLVSYVIWPIAALIASFPVLSFCAFIGGMTWIGHHKEMTRMEWKLNPAEEQQLLAYAKGAQEVCKAQELIDEPDGRYAYPRTFAREVNQCACTQVSVVLFNSESRDQMIRIINGAETPKYSNEQISTSHGFCGLVPLYDVDWMHEARAHTNISLD